MSFLSTKKGKLCIWAVILLIIAGLVIYAWNTPPTKVSNLLLKRIEWDYMQFLRQQYDWNVSVDGKCRNPATPREKPRGSPVIARCSPVPLLRLRRSPTLGIGVRNGTCHP